ncbi:MAG TPA: putative Ig domain-containing protein [Gemmataceae bacterium]|nr:putative Ig domain-containing protein [Gemmataceae bacterium]
MASRKALPQARFRPSLEILEDRLAPGNLLSSLSVILPLDSLESFETWDAAPYQLASSFEQDDVALTMEDTPAPADPASPPPDQVFAQLASRPDALSESSRVVANVQASEPIAQEDALNQQPLSQDENDSVHTASNDEHVLSTPPNGAANNNPQNLAGAYAGAGQGPGGSSTPNPSGGSPSGGGGSADLHLPSQTQLQQMMPGSNATGTPSSSTPPPVAFAPALNAPQVSLDSTLKAATDAGSHTSTSTATSSTSSGAAVTASVGNASSSGLPQSRPADIISLPPIFWHAGLINPGDQSNADGDSVSLQLLDYANNTTLTYSASNLPPGLSINSSTGLISGTIASNADTNSPYSVTVTATDSNNNSSSQSFNWTVSVISVQSPGDQVNNDGDAVSLSMTTNYNGSGTLSYSAAGLPPGLSINSTTGQITGTISATADTNSPYSVTVTASDGTNTSAQTFNWYVYSPVWVGVDGDQSNAVGDNVSVQVWASDANNNTLTYSATGLPSGLSINSTTGLISGTIALGADSSSPYAVTVTATDSAGYSASQTFNWTVSSVGLAQPSDQTNTEGDSVSLQLQGTGGSGTLTYSAVGLPPGLSLNATTGLISGTIAPGDAATGWYSVEVTATSGSSSFSQWFNWNINPVVNLAVPSDQNNNDGDSVSLQMSATDSLNNPLTYTATGLPAGLSINSSTGLISGTFATGDAANGPYVVTVTASDGTYSSSVTFNWNASPITILVPPISLVGGSVTSSVPVVTSTPPVLIAPTTLSPL